MRKTFILAIFSFAVAGVMMIASPASAIHKGAGALTCGNCHTMHSSQGGTNLPSMGGETGSFLLFRNGNVTDRSNVHLLCLQCHADDGSQGGVVYPPFNTTPPKVMLNDNPWDGVSFTSVGAGGDFSYIGTYDGSSLTLGGNGSGDEDMAVGKGHSIGISGATPPGNATAVAGAGSNQGTALNTFSCTSCHDSHGTDVTNNNINTYRNLRGGTVMSANNAENWWGNMSDFGDLGNSPFGGTTKSFCLNSVNACGTDDAAAGNVWPVYASATRENTYYFDTASPC
jgi:cytochrome c553